MLYGGGLLALAFLALWLYAIFDVISTDESLVRNLPKIVWLLLVIFIPTVGSIAWLLLGRPEGASFAPGNTAYRREQQARPQAPYRRSRAVAPDDDPRFLAQLDERAKRLREWEDDLKRREDELRRGDDEDGS